MARTGRPLRTAILVLVIVMIGALAVRQVVAHDAAKLLGDLWVSAMSVVLRIFAAFFGH
ncbi:MAG: hypothetical protein ABUS57_06620 [Pseudomonadota bacterium]